ncbi:hypothetical protein ABIH81_26080 [Micromonospora sp. HUAS YX12]|uniref:Uncharacterized protein n=1 Tax=Micromonospora sp. HUAS YX12 TaxID=3156396 RepID=A0AAU7QXW4_9ACTN
MRDPRRVLTVAEEADSVLTWYGLGRWVRLLRGRPVSQSVAGPRYQEREQRAAQERLLDQAQRLRGGRSPGQAELAE